MSTTNCLCCFWSFFTQSFNLKLGQSFGLIGAPWYFWTKAAPHHRIWKQRSNLSCVQILQMFGQDDFSSWSLPCPLSILLKGGMGISLIVCHSYVRDGIYAVEDTQFCLLTLLRIRILWTGHFVRISSLDNNWPDWFGHTGLKRFLSQIVYCFSVHQLKSLKLSF